MRRFCGQRQQARASDRTAAPFMAPSYTIFRHNIFFDNR
jgi:hypothetical protein